MITGSYGGFPTSALLSASPGLSLYDHGGITDIVPPVVFSYTYLDVPSAVGNFSIQTSAGLSMYFDNRARVASLVLTPVSSSGTALLDTVIFAWSASQATLEIRPFPPTSSWVCNPQFYLPYQPCGQPTTFQCKNTNSGAWVTSKVQICF